jgi:hypothetical protein
VPSQPPPYALSLGGLSLQLRGATYTAFVTAIRVQDCSLSRFLMLISRSHVGLALRGSERKIANVDPNATGFHVATNRERVRAASKHISSMQFRNPHEQADTNGRHTHFRHSSGGSRKAD